MVQEAASGSRAIPPFAMRTKKGGRTDGGAFQHLISRTREDSGGGGRGDLACRLMASLPPLKRPQSASVAFST